MEYSVKQLAELSGITSRTLRYYDHIGLLYPVRKDNGYRCYTSAHIDRLQQILLYREMGFPLGEIGRILDASEFEHLQALEAQLFALTLERTRLDILIGNVTRTISSAKGEIIMSDKEKAAGVR